MNKLLRNLLWIILIVPFIYVHNSLATTQVTLEWTANTETDLAGYRIFFREDGQPLYDYANPAWESIETTCTIYDLDETTTYHFVARAFDTEGYESGDSEEVTYVPPPIITVDTVDITSVSYDAKKDTLLVKATSDAPANSVTLTLWADFGFGSVELANLKYSDKNDNYSYTLRKVSTEPNSITVTSTGGGYAEMEL
jgi:hypothetical protein